MPSSLRAALRWWPVAVYPPALAAGALWLATLDADSRAAALAAASTNLDNLSTHPVPSLLASSVLVEGDVAAWVLLAALGLAGVVAAAGPLRAVAVAAAAHVVGTGVSEGVLALRVARGLEPAAARSIVDVGPSFVVVGVLVATVVGGKCRWWRAAAALGFGLLVPSLFDGLSRWDVAAVGHVTAIAVGAGGGVLLFRRRTTAAPAPSPAAP